MCTALPNGSKIAATSRSIPSWCRQMLVIGSAMYSANAPGRFTPTPMRVRAQVAPPGETVAAAAADHVPFPADNVAREEIGHIGAHRFDPSDKLVADRHRHRNRLLRPLVPLVDVDIGAANAGLQYADQNVVNADFRGGDIFEPQSRLALLLTRAFMTLR